MVELQNQNRAQYLIFTFYFRIYEIQNIQIQMKDVDLDALIKEDKEKNKHHNKKKFVSKKQRGEGARLHKRGAGAFRGGHRPQKGHHPGGARRIIRGARNQNQTKEFSRRNKNDRSKFRNNQSEERVEKKEHVPKPKKQQGPVQQKGRTLKVLGLHPDIKNQDLYKLFAAQGALEKCMIEQDNFGRNLPQAIVKYHAAEAAKNAIQNINGKKVLNSVLTVGPYKNKK